MTFVFVGIAILFVAFHVVRWRATPKLPEPSRSAWIPNSDAPKLSFLVPAWNAAEDIPEFIASYQQLNYPNKELILCSGGSDGSYKIAMQYATSGVFVLEQLPGEGKQIALNRSFPKSDGDIIYLTDIDCRPSDAVVNNLIRELGKFNSDAVTGSSRPMKEQLTDSFVLTQWAVEQATNPSAICKTTGILGRNAALTRGAVMASGYFSTPAPSGTDYTLAKELLRAGKVVMYVPGVPMPTEYPSTFSTYVRKQTRWVRNVFVLGRKYGALDEVRATTITLIMPFGFLALLGLALAGVSLAAFAFSVLVSHAILNRLWYMSHASMTPSFVASVRHFLADQVAAIKAGGQILLRLTPW